MNIPNEPESWDADFSFVYLRKLYAALAARFDFALLGDAAAVLHAPRSRPCVFVRHDLDVSIERAVPVAELEARSGARATYHVMIDSPFYDVHSARSAEGLRAIGALGHEIGLHYDVSARKTKDKDPSTRAADIGVACGVLEAVVGTPIRSVSFHLPIEDLIRGPLEIAGRVSGYAKELFAWYLSDSRARFREGEPLASLDRPRADVLQLLIHPIWWGEQHMPPGLRLRDFLLERARATNADFEELRARAWDHIIYRAADPG